MEKAKRRKNFGLALICFIVVALLGFSVYQHRQLKNITTAENTETASNEAATGLMPGPGAESITDETASVAAARTAQPGINDIDALEAELDSTESELNAAYRQMDDEMARKEALAEKQLELQRQYMQSPAFRNLMRSSLKNQYSEILDELNLSEEDRDIFADIYVDYNTAYSELRPEIASATSDAQKEDLRQRKADMIDTRDSQLQDLFGKDYETYHDYYEMTAIRSTIDGFKTSLNQDAPLTETQEKELSEMIYKEQLQVFAEVGYNPRYEIEFPSDVEDGAVGEMTQIMVEINTRSMEKSKDILSESQQEQFEGYLKNMMEMSELASQMSNL